MTSRVQVIVISWIWKVPVVCMESIMCSSAHFIYNAMGRYVRDLASIYD